MVTKTDQVVETLDPTVETATAEDRRQRQIELNQPAIALLQSWLEGDDEDEEEQRETLAILKQGIDEHRLPGQKLFSAS